MHGVRQAPPVERCASAPGGLELIVSVAGSGCVNWSNLDSDEQFASAKAHAMTDIGRGMFVSVSLAQSFAWRSSRNLRCVDLRHQSLIQSYFIGVTATLLFP